MKTLTYKEKDLKKAIIEIGFEGENNRKKIQIDCAETFAEYPNADVSMKIVPPKGSIYPKTVTREGDLVTWIVTDSDVANRGRGEFQITFTDGTTVAKTLIGRTNTDRSLRGTGTPPSGVQDWLDGAKQALEDLESAEVHQPTIGEDGYWYTWDQEAGEYVATETKAQGEDGQPGQDGQDGTDATPDLITKDYADLTFPVAKDSFCYHDGKLYQAKQDIQTSEQWTAAHWTETTVEEQLNTVKSALTSISDAIYQTNSVDVPLTISEGEYYKLTGKHSTYNQAKCSQVIPVTAGSKVYVTSKSQASVAGIIFYDSDTPSDNSFVSYDCYTGETVTYTNQEVTVPVSATHCIVQGNISSPLALKKRETINKIDKNTTDIAALQLDEEKVDDAYNAVFEEEHTSVELTMTEGKYYKLTGKYGTYDQAKCSQVFEVTAGEKVYVTAKSQASVAGILFYNSSSASESTFVSYDCYTGETVTFTEQEVTVPVGATHAVVQGNINSTVALERIGMGDKVQKNTQGIVGIKNDDEYMASVLRQRFMAIAKNFSWGTYPKMIISLRVDDLRTDIDLFAKIITGEYGFPLDVAACVKNIDKTVTGIVDPAEKIGDTRLEVCQWVQEHGGEVLVHPDTTFADATKIKELFLDSKRTFEDNGIHIRGTAVANSTPDAALKEKLDPYLYMYYDFSDAYGTNPPYNGMTFTMMNNFNNDIDDFESWLNTRTAYQTPVWVTLVMHEIGVDVTESFLRDVLDLIQTNVTQGKVAVMLWSEVYDTYGTF